MRQKLIFTFLAVLFLGSLFFLDLGFGIIPSAQALGFKEAGGFLDLAGLGAGFDTTQSDPAVIVSQIIVAILSFIGVIFLILMVYGGITWMTARGESEKVEKAKGIIRNAITGLIIVFLAYAIVYTISSFLI